MRLPLTSDCLIHHSQCGTSMPNSEGESMLLLNFVPATNSVASTGLPTLRCGSQLENR